MSLKLLGQLVILSARIAGRVLIQGYKKALNNALSNPEAAAKPVAGVTRSLPGKMTKEEAMKILNITEQSSRRDMVDSFQRLFKANDKDKGGSHYLQSKVLRAREALEDVYRE